MEAEEILDCFEGIEKMPHGNGDNMTEYYLQNLINVIQNAFIYDAEKCHRISIIEVFFINWLDWKNMRYFQRMIKQSPEIFAQIVINLFNKDHTQKQENMNHIYFIYDKARFCPAENNGKVDEGSLEEWINEYRKILLENNQEILFTFTLGRLLASSPVDDDGYEPCTAVRKIIENTATKR